MKLPRRQFLYLAAGGATLPTFSRVAAALDYPTRSVHITVGFPAGTTPDIVARLTGQSLSERLGQQFIVDNRPGAGGNVGTELVVRAPPDGYTLLLVVSTNAVNATLYTNLKFDFIRDIVPIGSIARTPFVMVLNPSFPAKTVPDFIAYAKANPGNVNYASAGNGTANHVSGELFKMMTGVDLVHVPYRGSYLPDLLGGQVQVTFAPIPTVIESIRTGKLRAIAVTTAGRVDALPDLPTVAESVRDYESSGWLGIGAPKTTSADIIEKLNKETSAIVADPNMKARLLGLGLEPMSMTPADFARFIVDETEKWAKVIKFANIKVD